MAVKPCCAHENDRYTTPAHANHSRANRGARAIPNKAIYERKFMFAKAISCHWQSDRGGWRIHAADQCQAENELRRPRMGHVHLRPGRRWRAAGLAAIGNFAVA